MAIPVLYFLVLASLKIFTSDPFFFSVQFNTVMTVTFLAHWGAANWRKS